MSDDGRYDDPIDPDDYDYNPAPDLNDESDVDGSKLVNLKDLKAAIDTMPKIKYGSKEVKHPVKGTSDKYSIVFSDPFEVSPKSVVASIENPNVNDPDDLSVITDNIWKNGFDFVVINKTGSSLSDLLLNITIHWIAVY